MYQIYPLNIVGFKVVTRVERTDGRTDGQTAQGTTIPYGPYNNTDADDDEDDDDDKDDEDDNMCMYKCNGKDNYSITDNNDPSDKNGNYHEVW